MTREILPTLDDEDDEQPTAVRELRKLAREVHRSVTPGQMAAISQNAIRVATIHATGHAENGECDDCPVCAMNLAKTGT